MWQYFELASHRLYPHTTEHRDEDKHVCNGVNLILHLASIAVALTHAGWHRGKKAFPTDWFPDNYSPISLCLSPLTCCHSKPFRWFLFPLTLAQAETPRMWRTVWEMLQPFPLDWSAARGDRLRCWNAPPSLTIPICLGKPWMSGGMTEGWRDRERERGEEAEWWSGY